MKGEIKFKKFLSIRISNQEGRTMWGERVEEDAERMAELGGQFACGVIASRDQFGSSTIKAQGNKPAIGVLLKIKWPETVSTGKTIPSI